MNVNYSDKNMLNSCFGLSVRTGTSIIAITNSIVAVVFIMIYIWQNNLNYGYSNADLNGGDVDQKKLIGSEIVLNYVTLVLIGFGFILLFASFGLKQATLKNATHKIYLWLLVGYVQLGTVIIMEMVLLMKHKHIEESLTLVVGFIFADVILVYQLLIVHSFYVEEQLVRETNYTRLCNKLSSQFQQQHSDEFQSIEL